MGIFPDQFYEIGDLVDVASVRRFPVAPLLAVDGTEVAILVCPFVPDADVSVLEPANVGVPPEEPEELNDDGPQVQLLRRQQRKAVREIEPHLRSEPRQGTRTGAVLLLDSFIEDPLHEIEILPHHPHPKRAGVNRKAAAKSAPQ